jgi:hypothetical protein
MNSAQSAANIASQSSWIFSGNGELITYPHDPSIAVKAAYPQAAVPLDNGANVTHK